MDLYLASSYVRLPPPRDINRQFFRHRQPNLHLPRGPGVLGRPLKTKSKIPIFLKTGLSQLNPLLIQAAPISKIIPPAPVQTLVLLIR